MAVSPFNRVVLRGITAELSSPIEDLRSRVPDHKRCGPFAWDLMFSHVVKKVCISERSADKLVVFVHRRMGPAVPFRPLLVVHRRPHSGYTDRVALRIRPALPILALLIVVAAVLLYVEAFLVYRLLQGEGLLTDLIIALGAAGVLGGYWAVFLARVAFDRPLLIDEVQELLDLPDDLV